MKNGIVKIIRRLFTAAALVTMLTGAVFSQKTLKELTEKNDSETIEQFCRRMIENAAFDDLTIKKGGNFEKFYVSNMKRKMMTRQSLKKH